MNEDQKNKVISTALEMNELLDGLIVMFSEIPNLPFEGVSREVWETLQLACAPTKAVLETNKKSMQLLGNIVDNDAFVAHAQAVIQNDL